MVSAPAEGAGKGLKTDCGKHGQRKEVRQSCSDPISYSNLCIRVPK